MPKIYRASSAARIKAGIILAILVIIGGYSARKGLGLWGGASAKPSDPFLFGLNLNTTVSALLLLLVALASLVVAWYVLVELLTSVKLDTKGIEVSAPGYRRFYAWNELGAVELTPTEAGEVDSALDDDKTTWLRLMPGPTAPASEVAPSALRPAQKPAPWWLRLLYPQARPDCLLLYPALADRPALVAAIQERLAQV